MKQQIEDIKQFQTAFGLGLKAKPEFPSRNVIGLRERLLNEEVTELKDAAVDDDLVEALDGIVDIMYVVLGTAAEYGLLDKVEAAWKLIHSNNMSKLAEDGTVHRRADGKVLKPANYKPVDLSVLFKS